MLKIAEVLLPVPLSKTFDYHLLCPAQIGQRVWVEFGKEKYQIGLIVGLREIGDNDEVETLKTITSVLEAFSIIDENWWQLLQFASRYYAEPLGKALRNALPARLRVKDVLVRPRITQFSLTEQGKQCFNQQILAKKAKRQHRLLGYFSEIGRKISPAELRQQGFQKSDWDKALENSYLQQSQHSPYQEDKPIQSANYSLNTEQKQILDTVIPQLNHHQAHLIYGVTGSGKTEIYIRLIEQVLLQNDGTKTAQILLLVPEIALTPQMLSRFTQRFGRRVATYHSGMTDTARRDVFLAAQSGELPILIGTRSAIFVPLPQLKLILVDEEHDVSYKQHEGFLYHARDLALYRAKQCDINVVLGSATPSLESLYNVKQGKIQQHNLSRRATSSALPNIEIVDRRGQSREQLLADNVMQAMRHVLQAGKQVLLFLNRRGFSPVMQCGSCGWSSDCPCCSVYQTVHLSHRQLCCHHCGHIEPLPVRCPSCQDSDVYFVGIGTEKLESQLNQQFPHHRILRLDRDKQTTAKQLYEALQQIHEGKVDIILGTQLVVKGHHFPKVDMVCVVDADSALFSSDFRAEERLYQQLIQVAGRAGRESDIGTVYIQSSVPEHEVFHALLKHDYADYADKMLAERQTFNLPPYRATATVKASALDKELLLAYLRAVNKTLTENCQAIEVLGPIPLAVEKVRNRFRAQLWLSAEDKQILQKNLPLLIKIVKHFDKSNRFKTVVDVDAVHG